MTKIRIIIYSSLLSIILIALSFSIFTLINKNKSNKINDEPAESTPTPPPVIEISWSDAVNFIQNCEIKIVFQKRNLDVTLTHKDDRVFKTKEPKYNDVYQEINHLRSDCNDTIQSVTE